MSIDARYKKALDDIRATQPDHSEISEMANGFSANLVPSATKAQRGFRWTAFATVGALAAGGAFLMVPTRADAIELMQQAMESVPASISKSTSGLRESTYWREGVKRRYRNVTDRTALPNAAGKGGKVVFDRGYDGINTWQISEDQAMAEVSDEQPWGFGPQSISLDWMLNGWTALRERARITEARMEAEGIKQIVVIIDESGKTATNAALGTGSSAQTRHTIRCRLSDGLPISHVGEVRNGDGWDQVFESTIEYPADIPDDLFAFKPPKNARVTDLREIRRLIQDATSSKRGEHTVGGTTIRVIGAFQESRGQIYVLWSGGAPLHLDLKARIQVRGENPAPLYLPFNEQPSQAEKQIMNRGERRGLVPDSPVRIRPFGIIENTEIYGLCASAKPGAQELQVTIPVFQKGEDRVLRYATKGSHFVSNGKQVGTVTVTLPVIQADSLSAYFGRITFGAMSFSGMNIPL